MNSLMTGEMLRMPPGEDGYVEPSDDYLENTRLIDELFDQARLIAAQAGEIDLLNGEIAHLRSMSSAGFARGTIKRAPTMGWPVVERREELL